MLTGRPDDILNTRKFLNAWKHLVLILCCIFALAPAPLFWNLSHCLILSIVSKPFIKHCWKFCFLTSASLLIFWTKTEPSLTTRHFLEWKAPHLAFSDFSEHEMALLILLALRQEPCRVRQRGPPAVSLDLPEARGRNFLTLFQLAVKNVPTPALFLAAVTKEVNSWSVSSACNHQFLSALTTILCMFPELGCSLRVLAVVWWLNKRCFGNSGSGPFAGGVDTSQRQRYFGSKSTNWVATMCFLQGAL